MRAADVLRMAQPAPRAFAPALVFGLLGAVSAVALLGTSAYLIARAAEQPPILYLSIAIVGVRGFALARASFRYLDRLAAHSAAFRALATLRVAIYERLVPLAPAGLAGTRRGDLLARLVGDVDELQNFPLRVVQPLVTSLLVAGLAVVGMWLLLPAAAVALAVALLFALVVGTVVHTAVSSRAERELAPLRGSFADETLDVISNLDVLTAFGAVDARLARLERSDARLTRSATRRAAGAGAAGAVLSLLAGLATVASLALGIAALTAAALAVAGSPVSDVTAATAATVWGGAGVALGGAGLTGPVLAVLALLPIAVFDVFAAVPLAASAWRQVHASAARVASALPAILPPELPRPARPAAPIPSAAPAGPALGAAPAGAPAPPAPPAAPARSTPPGEADTSAGPSRPQVSAAPTAPGAAPAGAAPAPPAAVPTPPAAAAAPARRTPPSEADTSAGPSRPQVSASRPAAAPSASGTRRPPFIRLDHVSARWPQFDTPAPTTIAVEKTRIVAPASSMQRSASPHVESGGTGGGAALRDVSVSIPPGARLLVTGPSGSGKTTLAAVLVRFLEHTGSFTIDGVDVRTLAPEDVRRTVGLCEQSPYIFDASLRQNLLFAREMASDDDLLAVLARVGLGDWARARSGLDARLGQHGARVSGGEAQRIALARVLLADFPVVVLDEPTANVDPTRADALLADLLAAAGPERSVVLISHTDVPAALVTQHLRLAASAPGRGRG